MKAKINKIDNAGYNIEGKSATSFSKWGAEFSIRLLARPSDIIVEIQDLSRLPDDRFIKDFYEKFSRHASASSLTVENVFPGLGHVASLDERNDKMMRGEGGPLLEADIPDDQRGMLPKERVCRKCGTPNSADSDYCTNCKQLLAGCPSCGHAKEEGMSFCTKCGSPLN